LLLRTDPYFTGLSGEAELDGSEDRQFQMPIGGFLLALQHAFLLDEESVVHPEITAYHNKTISWLAAQPGFRRYWKIWGKPVPLIFEDMSTTSCTHQKIEHSVLDARYWHLRHGENSKYFVAR
jgi:hypothetical protein